MTEERFHARDGARRARERARELPLEMKIQDLYHRGGKKAVHEAWRKVYAVETHHGRRNGTEVNRVM